MSLKDIDKINKDSVKYGNSISIESLEKLLRKFADKYYNSGEPYVSDKIFDKLKDILEERDPDNPFLTEVRAPLRGNKKKVKLPFPMNSLNKIKDDEPKKLEKFITKYDGPYILSDKLDGASAQLYKDATGKLFLYSLGDYIEGIDLSHLIDSLFADTDLKKMPKSCSVRGELMIEKEVFNSLDTTKKNVRNSVAGLVNAKKSIDKDILDVTKFVTYSVLNPLMTISEQLEKLEEWGFDVVYYKKYEEINKKLLEKFLIERRNKSKFDLDGIVCVDDSEIYKSETGYPDYAFAFKMDNPESIVTTEIISVEWNEKVYGYLKPTIKIKPVILSGNANTKSVTGYNARWIVNNKIGPGAIIRIVRSNEVIPKIVEVLKPAKKISLPDVPYKWTINDQGEEVDLVVDGYNIDSSKKINIEIMIHFFKTIGVKFMSEGIITKLSEEGYDNIEKLLDADDKDLMEINGLGEKMIKKIRSEIDKSFLTMELYTFMAASTIFGRGLGERKIKAVLNVYPNLMLEKWDKKTMKNKLLKVEGYQEKSANLFSNNYEDFIKFYKKINEIYDISRFMKKVTRVESESDDEENSDFKDKIFVFTGFRDESLQKIIEKGKGKVTTSVSSKTHMVIMADGGEISSKIQKAKDLGKTIMTKSEFKNKFGI